MHHYIYKYQLIIIGGSVVGVSIGNQDQLAVGVDGEETKEDVLSASHKVSYSLGLRLRCRLGSRVDV